MNRIFVYTLQFLLKLKSVPLGVNLLPVILFLIYEAKARGFPCDNEEAPSLLGCEKLSSDSPFGEISLLTLSDLFVKFLREVDEEFGAILRIEIGETPTLDNNLEEPKRPAL